MAEFVEENVREFKIDLDNIPSSLIYRLEEIEFIYSPLAASSLTCLIRQQSQSSPHPKQFAIGVGEHLQIEYYERLFERAFPGLLKQFPCLYYMVEEWHERATQLSPLEHILLRQSPQ